MLYFFEKLENVVYKFDDYELKNFKIFILYFFQFIHSKRQVFKEILFVLHNFHVFCPQRHRLGLCVSGCMGFKAVHSPILHCESGNAYELVRFFTGCLHATSIPQTLANPPHTHTRTGVFLFLPTPGVSPKKGEMLKFFSVFFFTIGENTGANFGVRSVFLLGFFSYQVFFSIVCFLR